MSAISTGNKAEARAVQYVKERGYEVQVCNYRYKRGEADIIAIDRENSPHLLVFIEVKYRSSTKFGHPEEFIDYKKMELLRNLAEYYTYVKDWQKDIRFDAIAINKKDEVSHFKDII